MLATEHACHRLRLLQFQLHCGIGGATIGYGLAPFNIMDARVLCQGASQLQITGW